MTTYYTSPTGSDSNPGTQTQPFKTIYKGINSSINGDIVHVMQGIYYPTYSTRPIINKSISVIGDGKTNTIIDGSTITQYTDGWKEGLVEITGNNIIFQGFTVQNPFGGSSGCAGIVITGSGDTVQQNLIQNTFDSGIKLYGSSGNYATNNIIRYNELYNICTGLNVQEGFSIVQSDTFEIYYNYIHHTGYLPSGGNSDNGGEGIDAKEYVRNGRIHHNYIYDARSVGIYVDGYNQTAQDIEVYQNIVEKIYAYGGGPTSRGDGLSVGPERGGTDIRINWHDNISYNNESGIFVCNGTPGGHDTDLTYNSNICYANSGNDVYVHNCGNTLSNILIENNYAQNIYIDPTIASAVTLSGNITDPTQIQNAFNANYSTLKSDILNNISLLSAALSINPKVLDVGQSVAFTVNATGGTAPYTYQW